MVNAIFHFVQQKKNCKIQRRKHHTIFCAIRTLFLGLISPSFPRHTVWCIVRLLDQCYFSCFPNKNCKIQARKHPLNLCTITTRLFGLLKWILKSPLFISVMGWSIVRFRDECLFDKQNCKSERRKHPRILTRFLGLLRLILSSLPVPSLMAGR